MKNVQFKYYDVFKMKSDFLLKQHLPFLLRFHKYDIVVGQKWLYGAGDIPILLCAHVDTVFPKPPTVITRTKNIIFGDRGLGADDRAGVSAILELIRRGHKPHVLFLDEEEVGGKGAKLAAKQLKPDIKYAIELDRKGSTDAVFYDCGNDEFIKYVKEFGFKEEWGIYSDIAELCPIWDIAGVNLSIGYEKAHTVGETLDVNDWLNTVKTVETMLKTPPDKVFDFQEVSYSSAYTSKWYKDDSYNTYGLASDVYGRFFFSFFPEDFKMSYGGSILDWENFFRRHSKDLEKTLFDALETFVDHHCYEIYEAESEEGQFEEEYF